MGKGGKGKSGRGRGGYDDDNGGGGGSSHYFAPDPEEAEEKERVKQEMKWKKKLREVEELEKKRDAGEKVDTLQLKKLDAKQSILDELAKLAPKPASPKKKTFDSDDESEIKAVPDTSIEEEDIDELKRKMEQELAELEQDKLELEEDAKRLEQEKLDKGRDKGKGGKGSKGKGKDPNAPPTVSMRAQQTAQGKASPPSTSGVERRQALPQASDEQKRQFKEDLGHWSDKFGCQYKFIGAELAARFKDAQQADDAMAELREIMKFDLGVEG